MQIFQRKQSKTRRRRLAARQILCKSHTPALDVFITCLFLNWNIYHHSRHRHRDDSQDCCSHSSRLNHSINLELEKISFHNFHRTFPWLFALYLTNFHWLFQILTELNDLIHWTLTPKWRCSDYGKNNRAFKMVFNFFQLSFRSSSTWIMWFHTFCIISLLLLRNRNFSSTKLVIHSLDFFYVDQSQPSSTLAYFFSIASLSAMSWAPGTTRMWIGG